jgi:glucose-1-phosphate cytidylyltransferase
MKLVIFAGGLGTRISEETDYIPKPMVKIGKKPILWHIIKYYSVFGFSEFIICGGYKINIIKNYFKKNSNRAWKVQVVNTGKSSNTGERLKKVKKIYR